MGRRKCLSPTGAVTAAATSTGLAPSRASAPGTLNHLGSLRVNDVVQVGTTLLETHLTIVHGHLLVNA